MSEQPTVNRYLKDKAFDHIDHALGRPVDPMRASYRNYFATDAKSDLATKFNASPFWRCNGVTNCGMAYFGVTDAGRAALRDHLKAIGSKTRVFQVTFNGYASNIAADSAAKAKYQHWLQCSDSNPDLTFAAYQRRVTVQVPA